MIAAIGSVIALYKVEADWLFIASAGGIAFLFAITAVINHMRDSTEARIREFLREFDSLEPKRIKAAAYLLGQGGRSDDVDPVLDFFESLGDCLERGGVSAKAVYQDFDVWIQGYWRRCFEYILAKQKTDNDIWENIFPLYDQMRKRSGRSWTPEEIQEFLEGELTL